LRIRWNVTADVRARQSVGPWHVDGLAGEDPVPIPDRQADGWILDRQDAARVVLSRQRGVVPDYEAALDVGQNAYSTVRVPRRDDLFNATVGGQHILFFILIPVGEDAWGRRRCRCLRRRLGRGVAWRRRRFGITAAHDGGTTEPGKHPAARRPPS